MTTLAARSWRVPVWEFDSCARSRAHSFLFMEAVMAKHKQQTSTSSATTTLSPKKTKPRTKAPSAQSESLQVKNPHAAGIDVHATVHGVCVPAQDATPPPKDHPAHMPANVRSFGTYTADLEMLADWLHACGVTTV